MFGWKENGEIRYPYFGISIPGTGSHKPNAPILKAVGLNGPPSHSSYNQAHR